mgnify:CR=1 FL=1
MANEFQQNPQQGYQPQPGFNPGMPPQGAGTPPIQLQEAVQRGIAGILNFKGRSRRSEYWWFVLAVGVATFVVRLIFGLFPGMFGAILKDLITLCGSFAMTAVLIRRLQDTNKPGILGWIQFGLHAIMVIIGFFIAIKVNSDPFGALAMADYLTFPAILLFIIGIINIVFCCMDSQPGTNQHGPSEKYPM